MHVSTAVRFVENKRSLVDSLLFGHRKGAFTGATEGQKGVFEAARGGTVFLDEIGDMSLESQMRLLRVLEQKTIIRVGETAEIPVESAQPPVNPPVNPGSLAPTDSFTLDLATHLLR
jgi:DNA-binding NtrC family response regulator